MTTNRVKHFFILMVLVAVSITYPGDCLAQTKSAARPKFVLSSSDTQMAAKVPEVYTANVFGCSGGNISPPLQWSGEPAGTKSFVLTLFDPDEHGDPSGWWHWIVYDLPANTHGLSKGAGAEHSTVLPSGTLQGRTDAGNDAYLGPCPDKGEAPHRYTFTIYALSVDKLDVPADSSGAMVVSTARDHLLGKAVFVAHYGR
jgi:Raf kinase inhibitor-like YbhB/YbcL family protein